MTCQKSEKCLEIYVLNVGHGDSIFIHFPNGKWGLVDCCINNK